VDEGFAVVGECAIEESAEKVCGRVRKHQRKSQRPLGFLLQRRELGSKSHHETTLQLFVLHSSARLSCDWKNTRQITGVWVKPSVHLNAIQSSTNANGLKPNLHMTKRGAQVRFALALGRFRTEDQAEPS
jgi:hypothetical protein